MVKASGSSWLDIVQIVPITARELLDATGANDPALGS